MVSRVLTKQNIIVLCLIHLSLVASYFEQRPECKDQCGGVTISYPFGIGQNCCYDKWFEIDCKRDKGSKYMPYLKAIGLEVTKVNQNSIGALIPVNLSRYDGGFDLRESPFSFSSMENTFVGIGCNIIAYTSDSDDDINVWCTTTCNTDVIPPNFNYYHMGCMAKLQQNIRRFNPVTLSAIPNGLGVSNESSAQTDASGFGLLVDQYWTRQQFVTKSLPEFNKIRFVTRGKENERYVPVVMEWEFYNATPASFGVDNTTTSCETKAQWFHVNKRFYSNTSLQCSCRAGYTGNPYLSNGCQVLGYPDYEEKEVNWKLIVIGICSGIGILFLVGWSYKVAKKLNHKSKKENYFKRNGGLLLKQQISSSECNIEKTKLFSSYELVKATDHFNVDRVLGQGGQGTVYKGMLSDGHIVAVKRSSIIDETKVGQFINEVVILSQINHRNVVKLLGCCLETEVPLLVYEFISNGTLFQHIHNPTEDFPLTWTARLRIAAEIAGALAYMHSAASMPIYHRDIKSTNILLDDKYKAKVADFGTSKSVNVDKTHFTTLVQGTFGYLDPEYFRSSQFTEKSDVYSFGVVLVELLTGRKPIFSNSLQEVKGLALHFFETMEQNNLLEMIDPQILKEGKIEEMTAVAHLAKTCLHMNGKRRPTMKEVAVQLEGIRMSEGNYNPYNNYEKVIEETEIEIEVAEGFHDSSASTGTW